MSAASGKNEETLLLAHTGTPEPDITRQMETLCRSTAFDGKGNQQKLLRYLVRKSLAGTVPSVAEIAAHVFGKKTLDPGDGQVRGETKKVREKLAEHYASAEAQPEEVRFEIPLRQYGVFAPRYCAPPPRAVIAEPADKAEVYQRVTVRGRIAALSADLRVWLVVRTPCGDLYPQCRVSRSSPEWEHEVRIGLAQWGADEGAEYEINLVAAHGDGDAAFYAYLKSGRDGFGPLLPTDSQVLDAKRVTRRDIRPST